MCREIANVRGNVITYGTILQQVENNSAPKLLGLQTEAAASWKKKKQRKNKSTLKILTVFKNTWELV